MFTHTHTRTHTRECSRTQLSAPIFTLSHTPSRTHARSPAQLSIPFFAVFLRGIGGAWLICLAVLMSQAAKDIVSKAVVIWFPISTYVACDWEHCLANMIFVMTALLSGKVGGGDGITWLIFVRDSLVPSTLGNAVGGVLMVAGLYAYANGIMDPGYDAKRGGVGA